MEFSLGSPRTTASGGGGSGGTKNGAESPPPAAEPYRQNDVGGKHAGSDSGDPDQEEDEILEESPCKRWSKRNEKVKQRDVPGIDASYLAMDNETGNEVVWNEVLFSERKNFRDQEEKIRAVFDHLTRLEHPNLVKFHKYWVDASSNKPRIIFITEYMSSGSMSRFLQRARSSGTKPNMKAWKTWNRQILSALSYLHSCDPPIVHANLTCNTIFIQQNGLVKIGCVAPSTIQHHVKTFNENIKNIHYLAPEYDHLTEATTKADIYSFGVCALEMATIGAVHSGTVNGGAAGGGADRERAEKEKAEKEKMTTTAAVAAPCEAGAAPTSSVASGCGLHLVTEELLRKGVESVEDPEQREFIERCLERDPEQRANVAELLIRLGPPEPEKHDETSLDEDGFLDSQQLPEEIRTSHEPTPGVLSADSAVSPPQEAAPNVVDSRPSLTPVASASAIAAMNLKQQVLPTIASAAAIVKKQDGYYNAQQSTTTPATTTTITTTTTSTTTNTTITTIPTINTNTTLTTTTPATTTTISITETVDIVTTAPPVPTATITTTSTTTMLPPIVSSAPDEGYHTTQSIVDAPCQDSSSTITTAEKPVVAQQQQHLETRQIVQMQAEVLEHEQQLRIQLQLDDQMNRQLTASLHEDDTAESLVSELVQLGFISELNSSELRQLLDNVLREYRSRESTKTTDDPVKPQTACDKNVL